jgi:hypothetical protein
VAAGLSPSALVSRWLLPAVWLTLPFTAGPSLAASLDPRSPAFRDTASIGLWVVWAATLAAMLIPRTVTLTAVRLAVPGALAASIWAVAATPAPAARDAVALAFVALATVLVLAPMTGERFVNGSAYGLERRLPLRAPAVLLLGPIQLAGAVVVVGVAVGPLLLAAQAWAPGVIALAVGWPAAWYAARSLHTLSRRWLVFTPAGLVLHDQLAVVEAVLVLRRHLDTIGPALEGTDARDLTVGAAGLALQVTVTEPLAISPTPPRRSPRDRPPVTSEDVDAFLFTPTRPGRVLAGAAERDLPVG